MIKSSVAVIDASIGIFQVVADPVSEKVDARWTSWARGGIQVCAPRLWLNETTSVLHKLFMQNQISEAMAQEALDALLGLKVELYDADEEMCRTASNWATHLNQYQAYDGFYLALAGRLEAPFWTSDKRLMNRAQQIGVDWVYWIGD
jgi:predicted nucleic acid-binding protein